MAEVDSPEILGLHHVTAICGDPQSNVDFYTGVLGLRLVKKTVNFDDPSSYHLYYGDALGTPGTIMTFFAWHRAVGRGSRGAGQITSVAFLIDEGSLDYWQERLEEAGVEVRGPETRFGESVLSFTDPDGLRLELVARQDASAEEFWEESPVPQQHAIRRIAGVTMCVSSIERTEEHFAEMLGFEPHAARGNRHRYLIDSDRGTSNVDVVVAPNILRGQMGVGAVHHVAWRTTAADDTQHLWQRHLRREGINVTPVIDRQYFESVYFREPGGVLFEIATDEPGFLVDEARSKLGSTLQLPAWLQEDRYAIETSLPELRSSGSDASERRPAR